MTSLSIHKDTSTRYLGTLIPIIFIVGLIIFFVMFFKKLYKGKLKKMMDKKVYLWGKKK
jgi:uncharacterized membrane protein YciS (DUF1049 family)